MTLIKCPECDLQVSDKAYSCPHCGYPLTKQDKPFIPSRSTKYKRLPNGFGQITEIKNKNLRNRFRVMITVAKTEEGKPISKLLKPQAYFSTYNEAYTALVEYNKNPYDLDAIITFQELYDRWSKKYYKEIVPSATRGYKNAYAYSSVLYNMQIKEIKTGHLKACIDNACVNRNGETTEASAGIKSRIKTLFNLMFDYALEFDLVDKNPARAFSLPENLLREIEDNKVDHIAFDDYEMKKLWDNIDKYNYVDYVIYQCYSGWRPIELCQISLSDVHLEEGYIEGGVKTDAGKNRIVPVHPRVRSIVEKEYKRAKELKSNWLFNWLDENRSRNPKLSYSRYRTAFSGVVRVLNLNPDHRPHDPRKTFVTMAKKYNIDEYALKRIVGHEIDDITESVYTERSLEWYKEEMQKIK